MNILFLTQNLPYPPNSGGRIKTFKTLQLLSRHHTVFLACFAKNKQELQEAKSLEKLGITVFVSVFPETVLPFREMRRFMAKSLRSPLPFLVYRHKQAKMQRLIDHILQTKQIEAIHVDHLVMAQYLPKIKKQIWVYDEHNIDSELHWQIFLKEQWNKFKAFSLLEWWRMKRYEQRIIPQFDYWLAISRRDRDRLIKLGADKQRIFFYPVFFTPRRGQKKFILPQTLLFVGMLSWWPNRDGLEWFITHVFPLVLGRFPALRLEVVGKNEAGKDFGSLFEHPNIHWCGSVKNIQPYLAKAWGCILPLRVGSGIRIKALTALAAGLPVVSTRKGIEGIQANSKEGVLIGDTPETLARAISQLLTQQLLRKQLSYSGKQFISRHYSRKKAEAVLNQIYGKS